MSELTTTYEWNTVPWRKLERRVFKLQKRIYQASQRGDVKTVHRLQKLLMKSWSAKCIAVRRITQDNQGRQTAGVDGLKNLSPKVRLLLINSLKLGHKAAPTRRVWIPKPGTQEKRPLGIPTIYDRARQALVKLALEPEWEAKFEPNSFGFRPGRSCHDAIEAIFNAINQKSKYVLDADIAKCFDCINHEALLDKLNTFPTIRRQVRAWLQAGVMDAKELFPTSEGTPQGGVISPLLANIALHGMENRIKQVARSLPGHKQKNADSLSLIRYADDFVIIHEDLAVVQRCKQVITEWLKDMGLELKTSKTRIVHTLHEHGQERPGFDFLGFTIRQYPVGKHQSGKRTNGELLGFKTFITPSQEKVKQHTEKLGKIINAHRTAPQQVLIEKLNPLIQGWANYYSTVISKETFSDVDSILYHQLRAWANYRHSHGSRYSVVSNYWLANQGQGWVFACKDKETGETLRLKTHRKTPIIRHIKVQGNRSPFDGNFVYWSIRMGKHPEIPIRMAKLLKSQKGKCAHCGLFFKDGDLMETDHITPKSQGGRDSYNNLQLLHRHCHDTKTAQDTKAVGEQVLDEQWLYANPFNCLSPQGNRGMR